MLTFVIWCIALYFIGLIIFFAASAVYALFVRCFTKPIRYNPHYR